SIQLPKSRMRTSVKIVAGLILLALLALVATHHRSTPDANKVSTRDPALRTTPNPNSMATLKAFQSSSQRPSAVAPSGQPRMEASPTENAATPSPEPTPANEEWEKKIDNILGSESDDDAQKARKLLALVPGLSEDGQLEAVTHASNLITDDQYAPLGQLLTNVRTPTDVLDLLMSDLAN